MIQTVVVTNNPSAGCIDQPLLTGNDAIIPCWHCSKHQKKMDKIKKKRSDFQFKRYPIPLIISSLKY
jgi:hypothetical protein